MKILLIGNYQPDEIESMERFTSMLEIHLTKFGHQVRVIRPKPYFAKLALPLKGLKKWLAYIDKYILFPAELREELFWADVVHICEQGYAIYTKYLQNIPHVVTCHDLLPIRSGLGEFSDYKTGWTGKILQKMIINGLNKAAKVACISEQTKMDVMRICSLNARNISFIPLGFNYPYSPMAPTEAKQRLTHLGIPPNSRFILHVGANHWYKNRLGVLSIFYHMMLKQNHPDFYLVMVGKSMTDEMRFFIKNHYLSQHVIELVNIDNENLRALYSTATALLFPSLQEGFGWPLIEAQACGCPVFTSNLPPMNDVGGEAAIYIKPNNHEDAASTILYHLPTIDTLKSESLLNSERFATEKMVSEYIMLYRQVINEFQHYSKTATQSNTLETL
ncbi:mannosyltransferase [Dulcicalothrix desertica PCC 7102]|uniref:Mannosyltransferase n=1 Tax=Dulcicalothrix desertica PCC 7102 TaxID=232991 RepID=A0A3S1J3S6_9CYAN|nr:glycosyltransferase family 1 protein [Dulcicalothrix desertica]RUT07167.1 mannosyltransferase [Dulcicalothrix desertica PCC 7102]TWH61838.1 glycosyltransferase involved in cell wall biosynthesis [Dulcicalothrix desertica PCC 7102]